MPHLQAAAPISAVLEGSSLLRDRRNRVLYTLLCVGSFPRWGAAWGLAVVECFVEASHGGVPLESLLRRGVCLRVYRGRMLLERGRVLR